ncbi:MAG: DUF58 domain-containing protein [Erysipelotrichales bacterium]|nr:DUF58 domain-containing protein [Erysipelotrichales bacterium]
MKDLVVDEKFLEQIELLQLSINDVLQGRFGGNHKTKTYGSSVEFADYREYIPGDDISKIDWSVFARTENLFLKLFLDERQLHTRIYIDASASMGFFSKGEKALELAASLAYLSIKYMDKVSIYYIQDNKIYGLLENVVGKDSFLNSIGKLNDITFKGSSDLSDAIVTSVVGYGDGNSIIISDFLTDSNYDNVIDHLRGKRRDVLCLQVLAPEELNPSFRGKVILYDSENNQKYYKNNINKSVVEAYQEALDYVTSRIRNYCQIRDANYLLVPSDRSLQDIFFKDLMSMEVVK